MISNSRGMSKSIQESRGQNGTRVLIDQPFHKDTIDIHVFIVKDGKRFRLKPTILEFEEYSSSSLSEPGISFSDLDQGKDFLEAMTGALTGRMEDGALELELKATKRHLEDIRSIALKNTSPAFPNS